MHIHLKDVLAPGGHVTCRFGLGCVPLAACVKTLQEIGYAGYLSVEHEPEHYNPTDDCIASCQMLHQWLGA